MLSTLYRKLLLLKECPTVTLIPTGREGSLLNFERILGTTMIELTLTSFVLNFPSHPTFKGGRISELLRVKVATASLNLHPMEQKVRYP